ncbi:recombinase family protein [Oscillospiraceae bacterium OttesenSCG-928-G22]|nr:recombinase family protein [Oscillospiraceae bacterium OttesenSCG-928-G22]
MDCIDSIRKLKALGIGVMFERENMNTLHMSNEMIFTMLSAFAQAESESISENVRWGKRHKMKQGSVPFQYKRILGYEKGPDGKPMIVPEQAATVNRIFASYLMGYSIPQIKAELEAEGVPAASGKPVWSLGSLHYMLQNEKYIGDALLQKTYVVDCISKQVKKNQGEIPQYYIENNHPAIIPRDIFHRVQAETARRSSKRRVSDKALTEKGKYSGKYALSELVVCGECGTRYRRTTWARGGKKKIVWRCISRLENGTQHCNASPTVEESRLHDAILRAMNLILETREDVLASLDDTLRSITGAGGSGLDRVSVQQELAELEALATNILRLASESGTASDFFEKNLTDLYDQRAALIDQLSEDDKLRASAGANSARLEALMVSIRSAPPQVDEYSDAIAREFLESVKIIDADTLVVIFRGGIEVEAEIIG